MAEKEFFVPIDKFEPFIDLIIKTERKKSETLGLKVCGLPITGLENIPVLAMMSRFNNILQNKQLAKEFNIEIQYNTEETYLERTITGYKVTQKGLDKLLCYIENQEYFKQIMKYSEEGKLVLAFDDDFVVKTNTRV